MFSSTKYVSLSLMHDIVSFVALAFSLAHVWKIFYFSSGGPHSDIIARNKLSTTYILIRWTLSFLSVRMC